MLHHWLVLPLQTALPLDSSGAIPILAFHLLLLPHFLIPVPLPVLEDLSPLDSALGIVHYPHSLRDLSSSVALYPAVRDNPQPPLFSRSRPYFQSPAPCFPLSPQHFISKMEPTTFPTKTSSFSQLSKFCYSSHFSLSKPSFYFSHTYKFPSPRNGSRHPSYPLLPLYPHTKILQ